MLTLPDRRLLLDPVNNMTIRYIRFAAVSRCRNDHNRGLPDLHPADPMLSDRNPQAPSLPCLSQDLRDHFFRHRHMRLIFQKSNCPPFIALPHIATEQYYRPGGRMMSPRKKPDQVDRLILYARSIPSIPHCWGGQR